MNSGASDNNSIRQQVVARIWPVALTFCVVYIPISFFVLEDYLSGCIEVVALQIIFISMAFYYKTRNIAIVSNVLAMLGIPVLMPWLVTGGPAGTGFFWSIVYVVWAFFVTEKKWAVRWLALHVIVALILVAFSLAGWVKIAYSLFQLANLLFAYVLTFILIYLFNNVLEYYLQLANQRAEEYSRLNSDLIAANKELEQFVYIASHDLQAPLQTISNYASLIDKKYAGKLDDTADRHLKVIVTAAGKMRELIKDLLDFSRIGREKTIAVIDTNNLLKEVIAGLDGVIKESGAKINSAVLPALQGNETEMKQLFQNLISNAIKFRRQDVIPEIHIVADKNETEYLFLIKDNGIGMDEQYYERIFVMFQRLHNASEYPGTGIGLAACKKIITSHNGKIWVESKLGEGSSFYFTIPK